MTNPAPPKPAPSEQIPGQGGFLWRSTRQLVLQMLIIIRHSPLRRPITKLLVNIHNSSYHWISFFSSYQGLHPKHAILNYHQFFIDHIASTNRVIDLGSGNGAVAYDIADHAAFVLGIDSHAPSIDLANKNYQRDNLKFAIGDITKLDLKEHYDVAILSNVLEHIDDRVNFLKHIKSHVPKILIRVPMITRDWISVYKKNQGYEYRLDHTHYIEFTELIFRHEIAEAGLTITHLHTKFGELYTVCENRN